MADNYGHVPRGPTRLMKALRWAMPGIRAAWLHAASFRLEAVLAAVMLPLGAWLGETGVEKALLVSTVLMVLSMELLNSSIEAVIERYGPEHHELAGRAKDMGSAAVFVSLSAVVAAWVLILAS